MRIISGAWRGRNLPRVTHGTRPTPDRAREALFSILYSRGLDFPSTRWLDLYCGTGAVGLEALSRGAAHCTFADRTPKVVDLVGKFLRQTGGLDRASLLQVDLPRQLARCQVAGGFDIVFADPPFAEPINLMDMAVNTDLDQLVAAGGMVILEREVRSEVSDPPDGWEMTSRRDYGRVEFYFYERCS